MKLYLKLALDGIRKNRRLYIPYVLIGSVMVMIHFLLGTLSAHPMLREIKGGGTLRTMLPFGADVVLLFALIFLFYCSRFILRQRNAEFGLYNVLGMGKKNLTWLMLVENLLTALISIAVGLFLGAALEKLAELGMLRLINTEADYAIHLDLNSMRKTLLGFGVIYLIILFSAVGKAWKSNPLQLLRSAQTGEKPPRANWLMALLGIVLLVWAYHDAVTIGNPMKALTTFFYAVVMVIVATYLLFVSGSVALCRLMQRSKRYYYRPNHFVSVSTMVYRMKRNGAGLASICVLLTMVLVMLSAVLSLYIGVEDSLLSRYPQDVSLRTSGADRDSLTEENFAPRRALLKELAPEQSDVREYVLAEVAGMFTDAGITIDVRSVSQSGVDYDDVGYLNILSLADYNRLTGEGLTLAQDECLLLCRNAAFTGDTFTLQGGEPLRVREVRPDTLGIGNTVNLMFATITLVTPDLEGVTAHLTNAYYGEVGLTMSLYWMYAFDMPGTAEEKTAMYDTLMLHMSELALPRGDRGGYSFDLGVREHERADFYGTFGGLFFLGILLGIVFIAAAVLIIYYKQLSEGYEDQKRFAILQKVGMTKREIRRSINSQVLTVFFAPLLLAGLHLAFAFPLVWKLLQMFMLNDQTLMILVTVCCFAGFGLMYAVVYRITSNAYYAIVSGTQKH